MGIFWHLIYEPQHAPEFTPVVGSWVSGCPCPPPEPGWFPGHWKFNWYLNSLKWDVEARYLLLSDDDLLASDFFTRMDAVDGDVLIASMKRGDHAPGQNGIPAYAPTTLLASPSNLGLGGIGGQQVMMAGWAYRRYRLGPGMCGDWEMIAGVLRSYVPVFVPEAFVLFNALEPGRWDKIPE